MRILRVGSGGAYKRVRELVGISNRLPAQHIAGTDTFEDSLSLCPAPGTCYMRSKATRDASNTGPSQHTRS